MAMLVEMKNAMKRAGLYIVVARPASGKENASISAIL
jgi:hypothetical protein